MVPTGFGNVYIHLYMCVCIYICVCVCGFRAYDDHFHCKPDTVKSHLGSDSSIGRNLGRIHHWEESLVKTYMDLAGLWEYLWRTVVCGLTWTDLVHHGQHHLPGMHAFTYSALDSGCYATSCFKFLPGWTVSWNCKMNKSFLPRGSFKFPWGSLSQQHKETTTEIITQMRGKWLRVIIWWVFSLT